MDMGKRRTDIEMVEYHLKEASRIMKRRGWLLMAGTGGVNILDREEYEKRMTAHEGLNCDAKGKFDAAKGVIVGHVEMASEGGDPW
jgi:uncharacterized protein YqgQ